MSVFGHYIRAFTFPCYLSVMKLFYSILTLLAFTLSASAETFRPQSVEVFFSPDGGCTQACVDAIDSAQKNVFVQAYSFTSAPIAQALVNAKKRGVFVVVILDKSQRTEKYSSADFLVHSGVTTFIDDRHAIAHNKVMVIDESVVITGSFNFTKSAEYRNAENLLVISSPELAKKYIENVWLHRAHSSRHIGR